MPADQLEGLGDGDYVVDAGRDRKGLDLMSPPAAADRGDDSALGAARDVRLKAGFADALDDVFDLLAVALSDMFTIMAVRFSIQLPKKQKAAILSRLRWNLELSCFSLRPAPILHLRRECKQKAAKVAEGAKSSHGLTASNSNLRYQYSSKRLRSHHVQS